MIKKIFELFKNWQQLPNYQLERRIDIFFALYLNDILQKYISNPIEIIIPEVPFKKDNNNRSIKIDYLCFCKSTKDIYLIELKTDMDSIDREQKDYIVKLAKSGENGFLKFVNDLKKLFCNTNKKNKYLKLFETLQENGLIYCDERLKKYRNNYNSCKKGVSKIIKSIKPIEGIKFKDYYYIQPICDNDDNRNVISFEYIINILKSHNRKDDISYYFIRFLENLKTRNEYKSINRCS